jgi:hypothetical protein
MKVAVAVAALALLSSPAVSSAQLLRGGPIGGRLEQFKERMTNKDESIHYDPTVLTAGVARSDAVAKLGEPNATQTQGGAREDVWAFYPDGAKFKDPEITGATIAAAVFTGGMSLAVRKARTTVQEQQLTLYRVRYDAQDRVSTVQTVPPTLGSEPAASPALPSSPAIE